MLPEEEGSGINFSSAMKAHRSPLAKKLFLIDGVTTIFFGRDFISVNIDEDVTQWDLVKPQVFAELMDHFASGKPALLPDGEYRTDTEIQEDDDEVVQMIKELLETRIRPSVQEDGGDILFIGFDTVTGIVKLQLAGSCVGCPSSSATLYSGVRNMLMHYVPEVQGIEQVHEDEDA